MCALLSSVIEEVKLGIGFCIICKNFEHGQLLHLSKSSGRSVSTNWQEQGSLCLHKNNFTLDCGWLCASRLPGLPLCQPSPTPPGFSQCDILRTWTCTLAWYWKGTTCLTLYRPRFLTEHVKVTSLSTPIDRLTKRFVNDGCNRISRCCLMLIDADWYADWYWLVDQEVCKRRLH